MFFSAKAIRRKANPFSRDRIAETRNSRARCSIYLAWLLIFASAATVWCSEPWQDEDFQQVDALRAAAEFQEVWRKLNARLPAEPGPQFLWRQARAAYDLGKSSPGSSDREQRFSQAVEYARRAIAQAPDSAEAHKWLAIALGELAQTAGVRKRVALSRQVKKHIDRSLALDPRDDIAHHVLGRWHLEVASLGFWAGTFVDLVYGGLPGASLEQAKKHFMQAIALHDRPFHHVALGRVYHEMGDTEAAKNELRTALAMPMTFPHERESLDAARQLLEEW